MKTPVESSPPQDAKIADEKSTRRALLHMLENLQGERDVIRVARMNWVDTVDSVRDPMMVHDAEFRVVRCNRAYAVLAGMDVREIIGKPYWQMFPKLAGPLPGCGHATASAEEKVEEQFRLPTGEVYLSKSFPLADLEGRTVQFLHVMEDITQRSREQQALENSERRFRSLIENATDLVCVLDQRGQIVYASPSLRQLGGYAPEEVLGRSIMEFTHPDDLQAAGAAMSAVVGKAGESIKAEIRLRRKDGSYAVMDSVAKNALDDPAVNGIVINARDNTERKQSENALRESEATYRALFDNMLNGMAHCEMLFENGQPTDFVYLRVNPAFTSQTGLKNVVGRRATEVIPNIRETDPGILETYGRVASSGVPERFEIFIKSLQQWHLVSLFSPKRGYFVSVFDVITERKRAESELHWRTTFFESLVKTSADGILVVDAKGKKIVQNQRMIEMWRIPKAFAEDPDDTAQLKFVTDQTADPKQFVDKVLYLYAHPEEKSQDEILLKDGTVFERYSASVLDSDEHSYGRIWSFRDITERKRADQQLKRLNWAMRALSQSNSALVHASTEQELFQSCCDAIAGTGVYPLVWIGLARDDAQRSVEPVASAGEAVAYLDGIEISWAESPHGTGPIGATIRTGTTQITENTALDARFAPWREKAQAMRLASAIAMSIRVNGRVIGSLAVYGREARAFDKAEIKLFEELAADIGYGVTSRRTTASYEASIIDRVRDAEKLRRSLESTIEAIAATMETRDPYTAGHQRRVAALAAAIAREMNLPVQTIEGIHFGALIHDLGKIQVPAEILAKPTRLTTLEYELIKTHAQAGYDIIKGVEFPWPVGLMVLQHHERLDGSGYPQGLKGEAIILEARILAVADVVEAMSSHRPYRAGLGIEAGLKAIEEKRGTGFESQAVDACLRLFREKNFAFETS